EEEMEKCRQNFKLIDQERRLLISEKTKSEEEAKRDVADRKAASTQAIMAEIRAKVARIAQEGDYDYVFDQSGKNTNQVSFFLYIKDATDITAAVIKELNQFSPRSPDE
ncbi:MAG: OmpH family outer membrane protein, partial [Akkermansiaceae bacterium]